MKTVSELADQLVDVIADEDPLLATMYGIRSKDRDLRDHDEDADRKLVARATAIGQAADSIPNASLSDEENVTKSVVRELAIAVRLRQAARAVEYTVTDFLVAPAARALHYLPRTPVAERLQAEDYLSRLAALPRYLASAGRRHLVGLETGRKPVARLVGAAIAHLDAALRTGGTDPLLGPLRRAELDTIAEEAGRLIDDEVRPALSRYRALLQDHVASAARPDEQPGLCWITDGASIYSGLVRVHTNTTRSPAELHRLGVELVGNLTAEYADVGGKVFGTTEPAEIFRRIRTDPALRWHDGEEMLAAAREAVARAEKLAPRWFSLVPDRACAVEPVPAGQAGAIPSGYYLMPSPDGDRPGTYFANTTRPTERFRHTSEVTAFHEAVPGHHLQVTRAQSLAGLPLLRQLPLSTAYVEGWGLYAERLADEMGLYSDDLSRLGVLAMDSLRAARLVVDTGLHAEGWSRSRAMDYLRDKTALPEVEIAAEIDRYITFPGQALAYMSGRLELERLRKAAARSMGAEFDIRAFHDTLLSRGALPMNVLADLTTAWVTGRTRG